MNENEIKDLANFLKNSCDDTPDESCVGCDCEECAAKALINAGYCRVADDEIVVKKSEYEKLKTHIEDLQTKLGAVMLCIKNTHENDISDLLRTQEQETARDILQIIKDEYEYIGDLERIIVKKYSIELEA